MARVFITGSTVAEAAKALLAEHKCEYSFGTEKDSPEDIARKLAAFQPDGLIVRKGIVDAKVIAASPALKAISKHGVGVDNIDVAAATRLRIPVMITALANYESVAEHAFALILGLSRGIAVQDRKIRQGVWDRSDYKAVDLRGKTLGLIGFGRIGRRLAELVRPLEMPILVFDPYVRAPEPCIQTTDLQELLSAADIVSVHCSLSPETRGLIGRAELASMKPGAWIVNTARGAVIDEAALIEALREKRIAAAALDTLEKEPPAPTHPLLAMDNVLVTAHVGGQSSTSFVNMGVGAVENILAVLEGRMPASGCLLNPEVYPAASTEGANR
jgi:D-3-phosphoglycerate dehydrogenase